MKAVVPVRKSLKIRTAFNILGPLLNPAGAAYGLIGVYSPAIAPLMASTLQRLGTKRALVVHSHGLDELTPMGDAELLEVTPQGTKSYRQHTSSSCGLPTHGPSALPSATHDCAQKSGPISVHSHGLLNAYFAACLQTINRPSATHDCAQD